MFDMQIEKSPFLTDLLGYQTHNLARMLYQEKGPLHLYHSMDLVHMMKKILETEILMSPKSCSLMF